MLLNDGTLLTCGSNKYGQIGVGAQMKETLSFEKQANDNNDGGAGGVLEGNQGEGNSDEGSDDSGSGNGGASDGNQSNNEEDLKQDEGMTPDD